jgi:preprotein translocase subunit SecA
MSGTAREVSSELSFVYGLNVVSIPPNRPSRRDDQPDQVYGTREEKWQAVIGEIRRRHANGQPVLIGTRTVEESEYLGELLTNAGLVHDVLNARQDHREAEIIAHAGECGRITVATNIAGRGTDIALGPGTEGRGGLHVIVTERHEAGRIDRQLIGRCARQGDPGSTVAILSIEDELVAMYYPRALRWSVDRSNSRGEQLPRWAGAIPVRFTQWLLERRHRRIRAELFKLDQQRSDQMAFAGRSE